MKEIKFRAWDKANSLLIKEYYFSQLLDGREISAVPDLDLLGKHDSNEVIRGVQYKGNPFKMSNLVLMQYTGLKDKNGVEIYEGDIIDFNDLDTDVRIGQEARDWRAKVVYNSFGTRFVAETFKPYWGGNKQFYQEYTEVIGNIYENPELLTKEEL